MGHSFFHFVPKDNDFNPVFLEILRPYYEFFEQQVCEFKSCTEFPKKYIDTFFHRENMFEEASEFLDKTYEIYHSSILDTF